MIANDRWRTVLEGERPTTVKTITTTVKNCTDYNIWMQGGAVSTTRGKAGQYGWSPFGRWISKSSCFSGEKESNSSYAPEGKTYIYYTENKAPGKNTTAPYETIELNGKSQNYPFSKFSVKVEAKPVLMYYSALDPTDFSYELEGWTGWTYEYYDYIITVTPKK